MHCFEVQEELLLFRHQMLPAARAVAITAHIDECPYCQGELNRANALQSLFAGAQEIPGAQAPPFANVPSETVPSATVQPGSGESEIVSKEQMEAMRARLQGRLIEFRQRIAQSSGQASEREGVVPFAQSNPTLLSSSLPTSSALSSSPNSFIATTHPATNVEAVMGKPPEAVSTGGVADAHHQSNPQSTGIFTATGEGVPGAIRNLVSLVLNYNPDFHNALQIVDLVGSRFGLRSANPQLGFVRGGPPGEDATPAGQSAGPNEAVEADQSYSHIENGDGVSGERTFPPIPFEGFFLTLTTMPLGEGFYLRFYLTDVEDKPLQTCAIELHREDGQIEGTELMDGIAEFLDVPGGRHRLTFSAYPTAEFTLEIEAMV